MVYIPKTRWQAFGVHLVISLLVFLVLASVIYFFWYPGFLFWYDGGVEGIRLIAGVDFLVGPILTLCVYNLGKKELKFDLAVVALLQAACLVGGMWTVWQTRPVAVVYFDGGFKTISYQTYLDYDVDPASVPLLQAQWPVWVAVKLPEESTPGYQDEGKRLMFRNNAYYHSDYYVPYDPVMMDISKEQITQEQIKNNVPELSERLSVQGDNLRVFSLGCGSGFGYLLMDTDNEILDVVITMERRTAYSQLLDALQIKLVELGNLRR